MASPSDFQLAGWCRKMGSSSFPMSGKVSGLFLPAQLCFRVPSGNKGWRGSLGRAAELAELLREVLLAALPRALLSQQLLAEPAPSALGGAVAPDRSRVSLAESLPAQGDLAKQFVFVPVPSCYNGSFLIYCTDLGADPRCVSSSRCRRVCWRSFSSRRPCLAALAW